MATTGAVRENHLPNGHKDEDDAVKKEEHGKIRRIPGFQE